MQGVFFNCLLSAVVGVVSSVGTVWYLSAHSENAKSADSKNATAETLKAKLIEVDSLIVNNDVLLIDPETNSPTIELKDGSLYVQKDVYAERVGAFRILGQKLQATPDDPLDMKSQAFGEICFTDDGGACIGLKSPRESHSITIGFDKNEKGCILSKNNDDNSFVAQAVFLKPSANELASAQPDAPNGSAPSANAAPAADSAVAANTSAEKTADAHASDAESASENAAVAETPGGTIKK